MGLSYNPGGIESFVMSYYRQLVEKGIQFDFISMFPKLAHEEEILRLGGKIYHVADGRKRPLLFQKELRRILQNGQYEVIHVNMLSAANILPLMAAHSAGVPKVIAHSHNTDSPGLVRNLLHQINKKKIGKYATDYFACSKRAGHWLFPRKIIENGHCKIIHNAIDVERFLYHEQSALEVKKELGIEKKLVIGHVGRFEEQKNHKFLIEVFRKVIEKRKDAVLLLIGAGELKKDIKTIVQRYGLERNVIFLGVRKDVPRLWQAIDIFLFPSLFEGLPIVAVEAQAAGVSCLLSDSITKEVKITDRVEFYSLKKTPEEWAEKVLQLPEKKSEENNQRIYARFSDKGYEIKGAAEELSKRYHM